MKLAEFITESWNAFVHLNRARSITVITKYTCSLLKVFHAEKLFSNIRLLKERTRILEFKGGESDNVIWGKDYGGIITRRNRCELETKIHLCFSKFLETLNEKEILRINPAKIQFL